MSAIWNSYSKSDTARMPRTMQSAASRFTRSTSRPSNDVMRMRSRPRVASSISSSRSFTVNSGSLDGLATTATMSSSKMRRLRSMRSRCPLCIGSNIPGYTARLPTRDLRRKDRARNRLSLGRGAEECQGTSPRTGGSSTRPARRRRARAASSCVLDHDDRRREAGTRPSGPARARGRRAASRRADPGRPRRTARRRGPAFPRPAPRRPGARAPGPRARAHRRCRGARAAPRGPSPRTRRGARRGTAPRFPRPPPPRRGPGRGRRRRTASGCPGTRCGPGPRWAVSSGPAASPGAAPSAPPR